MIQTKNKVTYAAPEDTKFNFSVLLVTQSKQNLDFIYVPFKWMFM